MRLLQKIFMTRDFSIYLYVFTAEMRENIRFLGTEDAVQNQFEFVANICIKFWNIGWKYLH